MSILEESSSQVQSLGIFPKEARNKKFTKTVKRICTLMVHLALQEEKVAVYLPALW